jgi:ABC-2 type transport system permease protein
MTTTPTTAVEAVDTTRRSVLLATTRPSRPGAVSASLIFARRGLLKIRHVPEQLGDVIGIPIIFTLMFTYLFGGALAGSTTAYLQFILPGTLVMTIVLVTMYAGIGLNTDVTTGVFDRFRSMSFWRPAAIIGALIGDVGRYLLASALVLALGFILGFRPAGGVIGVLLAEALILVFALSLSWVWTSLGLILRTPSAVMSLGSIVLFPLSLASNVFVNPHTMPNWLQAFVNVNPVTHLVLAARGLMSGVIPTSEIVWALVASAALIAIFAPLTLYLYQTKR